MSLSKRDAKLRAAALSGIDCATDRLCGPFASDAIQAVLYDHPKVALRKIAQAETHLAKAKPALRAWAGRSV